MWYCHWNSATRNDCFMPPRFDSLHDRWVRLLRMMKPDDFSRPVNHPENGRITLGSNAGDVCGARPTPCRTHHGIAPGRQLVASTTNGFISTGVVCSH